MGLTNNPARAGTAVYGKGFGLSIFCGHPPAFADVGYTARPSLSENHATHRAAILRARPPPSPAPVMASAERWPAPECRRLSPVAL
jgi:hypothetical protein